MIILQTGFSMVRTGDSDIAVYFLIGLGAVIAVILAGVMIGRARRPRTADDMRKYSRKIFLRTAVSMGLPKEQAGVLESLVQSCKLKQPFLVFSSQALLDDVLRKGLLVIENSRELPENQKEQKKSQIYQIKQALERGGRKEAAVQSTILLKPGQPLTVAPEGGSQISSRVVSNMKDYLTIAVPAETRWPRGTPLTVHLWRQSDAGYVFQSKVLGYDTVRGVSCVLVQHSRTLRREQRRKNKRREVMRACFCYPVHIEEGDTQKGEKRASIEQSRRALGTVLDLSAGGCAVQSLKPFNPGTLLMVEFEIEKRAPIRAFGKVLRVKREKAGGTMRIVFTSVTRQFLNRICAFVYDFSRPATLGQAATQGRPQSGASPRFRGIMRKG